MRRSFDTPAEAHQLGQEAVSIGAIAGYVVEYQVHLILIDTEQAHLPTDTQEVSHVQ